MPALAILKISFLFINNKFPLASTFGAILNAELELDSIALFKAPIPKPPVFSFANCTVHNTFAVAKSTKLTNKKPSFTLSISNPLSSDIVSVFLTLISSSLLSYTTLPSLVYTIMAFLLLPSASIFCLTIFINDVPSITAISSSLKPSKLLFSQITDFVSGSIPINFKSLPVIISPVNDCSKKLVFTIALSADISNNGSVL